MKITDNHGNVTEITANNIPYVDENEDKNKSVNEKISQLSESIADLKEDLESVIVNSPNLFNKLSDNTIRGYFSGTTITKNNNYMLTQPIKIEANVSYKFVHSVEDLGTNNRYIICTAEGEYLDWGNFVVGERNIVILKRNTECYARFNVGRIEKADTFMLCMEGVYPSTYIPYGEYVVSNSITDEIATLNSLSDKIITTPNLYNNKSDNIYHGFCVGDSLTPNENYRMTHPILLKRGVTYKYLFPSELGTNIKFAEVTKNGDFVDWYNVVKSGDYATITNYVDRYVRINIGYAVNEDYFYISEADKYPDSYIPYGNYVKDNVMHKNPLWNKKAVFTGDSICYGEGSNGGYSKLIGLNNHMVVQNIAVSGATIVNTSGRFCISNSIASLDSDADYVILEGGVNDASLTLPMGNITVNYWRSFDESTFCGAFEKMLNDVWEKYPTQKKGYILVHKCTGGFSSDIGSGTNGAYYDAVIKMCKKWGIPVLNLQDSVPPMAFWGASEKPQLKAIREAYTLNGDGWHPNLEGYKKFYVPVIENWMKEL